MDENVIFEYHPYKNEKFVRICYRVIFACLIMFIFTTIMVTILGITSKEYENFIVSALTLLVSIVVFPPVRSIKNRRLKIYSDRICMSNTSKIEKSYFLDTKQMIIKIVLITKSSSSCFKLSFYDNNGQIICSFILYESVVSRLKIEERRKKWGDDLTKVGCSIIDKSHYLVKKSIFNDPSYESPDYYYNDEDCLYVRTLLKRKMKIITFAAIISLFLIITAFTVLYIMQIMELMIAIILFFVILYQFSLVWLVRKNIKKMLDSDNSKLLEKEFSKDAIEKRKKIAL